jgi:hypothetical protein
MRRSNSVGIKMLMHIKLFRISLAVINAELSLIFLTKDDNASLVLSRKGHGISDVFSH